MAEYYDEYRTDGYLKEPISPGLQKWVKIAFIAAAITAVVAFKYFGCQNGPDYELSEPVSKQESMLPSQFAHNTADLEYKIGT